MTAVTARAPPAQDHYQAPCEPLWTITHLAVSRQTSRGVPPITVLTTTITTRSAAGRDLQLSRGRRGRRVRSVRRPFGRVLETPWNIHCELVAEAVLVQGNGGKKRLNGQLGCLGSGLSTDKEHHCISLSIARDMMRGPRWTEES